MRVVEVGQYFMTKDTGDLRQFRTVACREYTLPRDDRASQPKGWIQGNMRIGPVLEVTTSFQHFKYGIEIQIKSMNQDDSHSWDRISYGTVKYVTDFEINSHKYSIGLMSVGNLVWQQEEVQKEDISIALIIREQSFTSVLFRDTQYIISLILCYRTM